MNGLAGRRTRRGRFGLLRRGLPGVLHEIVHPLLHLFRSQIFLVGGDRPEVTSQIGSTSGLSLASHRRTFQAWELGAWSAALEHDFHEQTEVGANGGLRYRQRPPEWRKAFVEDMQAGRYFETAISHPALLFVAEDLDFERIRQFSRDQQRELRPMAEAVVKARRIQIESYQKNGPHVRVVRMQKTSHYPFVDRTREVATQMRDFLRSSD